ncbi:cation diffusion facilitator family transporter [Butyrivibrio sp. YAB3001]|uniref:cation diffusion facilitator family transporter n=1 Tax=Butyrivibrio sp. YAB3001 TaxID=1520812 RepID=UPI0008F62EAC|nr:cation diffusion facilitator family transporter [Butyrivibrio sp. YAB3001]SFB83904.1 cation diffusion facilitator family transporter [Butyrivibrio sp. YAB3001]
MAELPIIKDRGKTIIRTSLVGIVVNLLLAGFKFSIGVISGSIAIMMDAVNNLSDTLSSIITIVGTNLAGKAPDKKHPLGYGRIEYMSALSISLIILYAGITSFVESVKAIIHPETPNYSTIALIIVAIAVIVKLLLGQFFISTGKEIKSESLIASGTDARFDSIISLATLVAAFIYIFTGLSLESWLASIISVLLVKTGLEMLRDTMSQILGERIDSATSKAVKSTILSIEGVTGAYDLFFSDYGPDRVFASVHVEIPDTYTADKIDILTRQITEKVYEKHNISIISVGIYSVNTKNDHAQKIRTDIAKIVKSHSGILQMHGFFIDFEKKIIRFDLVVEFLPNRQEVFNSTIKDIQTHYPDYSVFANMDVSYSD